MSNLFHHSNNTVGELTKKLASKLTDLGLRLTTAESCTGGKLSVALCAEENTAEFYSASLSADTQARRWRRCPRSHRRSNHKITKYQFDK